MLSNRRIASQLYSPALVSISKCERANERTRAASRTDRGRVSHGGDRKTNALSFADRHTGEQSCSFLAFRYVVLESLSLFLCFILPVSDVYTCARAFANTNCLFSLLPSLLACLSICCLSVFLHVCMFVCLSRSGSLESSQSVCLSV